MKNVLSFLPVQTVPIHYHDEPEDIFYSIASFSCYEKNFKQIFRYLLFWRFIEWLKSEIFETAQEIALKSSFQ